jgi:cholesterol oxidase
MHEGSAVGWVDCDALGGKLPVEKGVFNLFVEGDDPTRTKMLYRLFFADAEGTPLTLTGFKDVKDDRGFDVWKDTSTLYTRILRGHVAVGADDGADVVASGIITIYKHDFAKQLTTFRVYGGDAGERLAALGMFGRLFMGKLWDLYKDQAEAAAR